MFEYLYFVLGFAFLLKGADFLVEGSSSIARKLGVAPMVIGLTLVAFGTSFPELVINIVSAPASNDIPIGNILGSNIANILLILGIAAIVTPLAIPKNTVWKEIPFSLVSVIVLAIMANDFLLSGIPSVLTRGDGLILILFFLLFLYYIAILIKKSLADNKEIQLHKSKQKKKEQDVIEQKPLEKQIKIERYPYLVSSLFVVLGMLGMYIGGRWVVDGGINIATTFGISEAVIGLTVLALGTSLPELAASLIAIRKKKLEIAVGNIVGSSIFNIFFVLGISSIIRPLVFAPALNIDILAVVGSTVLLFIFMFLGSRHTLNRSKGMAFLLFYAAYIVTLIYRG